MKNLNQTACLVVLIKFVAFDPQIELANFELFSSSPQEFSIFVSDRFPTRDWHSVGHFIAQDERTVQSFSLEPFLSFGKFIKVSCQFWLQQRFPFNSLASFAAQNINHQ